MDLTNLLLSVLLLLVLVAAVGAWRAPRSPQPAAGDLEKRLAATERRLLDEIDRLSRGLSAVSRDEARAQSRGLADLEVSLAKSLAEMRREQSASLERIRESVDERLQTTLESRLGESFRLVSDQLESVHRGLGDMQKLAEGVGDLKRVLSNVKVRGTFGEAQLGALLEQIMAPEQFKRNVATIPGSDERVEFAIVLPGAGDGHAPVLLPIDAKFPQEDYLRLALAHEAGDTEGAEAARRSLGRTIRAEADAIREKYVAPPHTTDFAILYLPTEGLFAEVMRLPGLAEDLQSRRRIIPAGPTTLAALLSSLQMGFRTLAIEKRSAEVWRVLGAVKGEFQKFALSLDAVSKKLQEATTKIDETTRRSRVMQRTLTQVETGPSLDERPKLSVVGDGD